MSCTLTKELIGFDTLEVRKPETKALLNCHAKDYFTSTEYFLIRKQIQGIKHSVFQSI